MKIFIPIILIIASAGLIFGYALPVWSGTLALQDNFFNPPPKKNVAELKIQKQKYVDALAEAMEVNKKLADLVKKKAAISPERLARLDKLIPRNLDVVRFVVDVTTIAARHGLTIQEVNVPDNQAALAEITPGSTANSMIDARSFHFKVTTAYPTFLAFTRDLENSLRIIEIPEITFTPSEKPVGSYDALFTVKAFFMKPLTSAKK